MKILAYRFSAFGDVTMTAASIRRIIQANPEVEITFVSRKVFEPLFHGLPRFRFYAVDLDAYKGIFGLSQLYSEISKLSQWDAVLDLHSVMRTWTLNTLFRISGKPVYVLEKGRQEKKLLTQKKNKKMEQLKHSIERTLDVFQAAGLLTSAVPEKSILSNPSDHNLQSLANFLTKHQLTKSTSWIAIAPFSVHQQKEWSLDRIKEVLKVLTERGYQVFLFGAGAAEVNKLKELEAAYENTYNLAGVLTLEEEILLLDKIDVMVSMDSFNMHLASLMGIPTVSIWGATHPYAGFGPTGINKEFIVQRDDLDCRPCSVFGNKECFRGDLACLEIPASKVLRTIDRALGNNSGSSFVD